MTLDIKSIVAKSRRAQGLPEIVNDPGVLQRVAALLQHVDDDDASEPSSDTRRAG